MPYYPDLAVTEQYSLLTSTFLGLNKGLSIADGEMAEMLNLTADNYPVLTTRQRRTLVEWQDGKTSFDDPQGIIGGERLVTIDGDTLYVDGTPVSGIELSTDDGMRPKHLVTMGAYVCIWPDKKYVNLADLTDKGDMGARWGATELPKAVPCNANGEAVASGTTATHVKISATGIGRQFRADDTVWISGADAITVQGEPETVTTTGTLSFHTAAVGLVSRWTGTEKNGSVSYSTPSTAEVYRSITVSGIPDGAVVKSARLYYDVTQSPYTGAKIRTIASQTISSAGGYVNVSVTGNGAVSIPFVFQAKGGAGGTGTSTAHLELDNMHLDIAWEKTGTQGTTVKPSEENVAAIKELNTSCIVRNRGDDYIVVTGKITSELTLGNSLTVELRIPDFSYVTESQNRIWGCRYAMVDGKLVNEIQACALGDFRNWYSYQGTAADSYAVSVGSDGKFTAAATLKGYPIFFKEGCMHRIAGSTPATFQMVTTSVRGVQDGCWRSVMQVGENLYYKSRTDVMMYDGALPQSVSAALGRDRYYDAAAGRYGDKYYLSMRHDTDGWSLFVYDTAKGLWHREDASEIAYFATVSGDMYFIRNNVLLSAAGQTATTEPDFNWSATFGVYGYSYEGQKYLSRFNIRAWMAKGAKMRLEIMYDSDGEWHDEGEMRCTKTTTFMLPVLPRRCDHCQLRISGVGEMKLFSIARVLEYGGDG